MRWWRTYLDEAAGASANPSSPHQEGRRARATLERARVTLARELEVQSDDVIFTSGATESNALAILGHVRALRAAAGRDTVGRNHIHVLYLPSAHASIVENIRILAEEGVIVEPLPIKNYRVDTDALAAMIRKETALVTMEAVCGETGVVWNTREVAGVLRKGVATPLLHVDASQAPLTEKCTRAHFNADMLTLDASKVGRVRGMGALIAHRTIPLMPLYGGGGQERGLRSGSESPELAKAFVQAFRRTRDDRVVFRSKAALARAMLIERITSSISDVYIQEGKHQAPHILSLSLPGRDTDYLVTLLDEAGYAVATRSACETDSETGSRAVLALTADEAKARATLRVSWGKGIRLWQLRFFVRALVRAVAFIDKSSLG